MENCTRILNHCRLGFVITEGVTQHWTIFQNIWGEESEKQSFVGLQPNWHQIEADSELVAKIIGQAVRTMEFLNTKLLKDETHY